MASVFNQVSCDHVCGLEIVRRLGSLKVSGFLLANSALTTSSPPNLPRSKTIFQPLAQASTARAPLGGRDRSETDRTYIISPSRCRTVRHEPRYQAVRLCCPRSPDDLRKVRSGDISSVPWGLLRHGIQTVNCSIGKWLFLNIAKTGLHVPAGMLA